MTVRRPQKRRARRKGTFRVRRDAPGDCPPPGKSCGASSSGMPVEGGRRHPAPCGGVAYLKRAEVHPGQPLPRGGLATRPRPPPVWRRGRPPSVADSGGGRHLRPAETGVAPSVSGPRKRESSQARGGRRRPRTAESGAGPETGEGQVGGPAEGTPLPENPGEVPVGRAARKEGERG